MIRRFTCGVPAARGSTTATTFGGTRRWFGASAASSGSSSNGSSGSALWAGLLFAGSAAFTAAYRAAAPQHQQQQHAGQQKQQPALCGWFSSDEKKPDAAAVVTKTPPVDAHASLPVLTCPMSLAPEVPPPITRRFPALLRVDLEYVSFIGQLTRQWKYEYWAFCPFGTTKSDLPRCVPGPFLRTRVGDVLEVNVTNRHYVPHNIDFHAVDGPGGGAPLLLADEGQSRSAHFKLTNPGLFVYHCASAPIPMHIANGMYGLILVEPEGGLPIVDKEFYVMQSEFYCDPPEKGENQAMHAYDEGLKENAQVCVFNGREGALTDTGMLRAKVGDRVRMFVGNGGPNLSSAFHVIGCIFDALYREGDLLSPPARCVQTTTIPPGGAAVVEMNLKVPGNFTIVDHALFRLDKGCVGFMSVTGDPAPEVYHTLGTPTYCAGCKLHP